MGKTEKGTLWVVGDKTPAFDFYQYFYNIEDESVEMLLRLFTEIDLKEIRELCSSDILKAKRRMALEITALVHGMEEAKRTEQTAISLFSDKSKSADAPSCSVIVPEGDLLLVDLMADIKFVPSKSEARRLIQQGAVSVDDAKVDSINFAFAHSEMKKKGSVLIKRGKKNFIKVDFT
ncbi:MAG TPA: tyrosine--tRNA ligase [Spirochaetaceae bacterium]|nr:tyrosine--tRNA ligase [Spirochaetaceae bacterium]